MDKGDNIDDWFTGEGYTAKGKEIITRIIKYKADMKAAIGGDKSMLILAEIEKNDVLMLKIGKELRLNIYHIILSFPAASMLLSAWQK
jgi:hypothetical protein